MARVKDPLGGGFHQTYRDLDGEPVVLSADDVEYGTRAIRRYATDDTDLDQLLKMCGLREGKVDRVPSVLPCGHSSVTSRRRPTGRGSECAPCRARNRRSAS